MECLRGKGCEERLLARQRTLPLSKPHLQLLGIADDDDAALQAGSLSR